MELCLADTQPAVRNEQELVCVGAEPRGHQPAPVCPLQHCQLCQSISTLVPILCSRHASPCVQDSGSQKRQLPAPALPLGALWGAAWELAFPQIPQEFLLELFLSPLTHLSSEPLRARGLHMATLFLEPVRKSLPVADSRRLLRLWMSDPV